MGWAGVIVPSRIYDKLRANSWNPFRQSCADAYNFITNIRTSFVLHVQVQKGCDVHCPKLEASQSSHCKLQLGGNWLETFPELGRLRCDFVCLRLACRAVEQLLWEPFHVLILRLSRQCRNLRAFFKLWIARKSSVFVVESDCRLLALHTQSTWIRQFDRSCILRSLFIETTRWALQTHYPCLFNAQLPYFRGTA